MLINVQEIGRFLKGMVVFFRGFLSCNGSFLPVGEVVWCTIEVCCNLLFAFRPGLGAANCAL